MTVARPVVDLSRSEPAIAASDTVFPSAFKNVTTFEDESGFRNRLVLVPGQWTADPTPGADPNDGFQRLFDSMTSTVCYAPSCDPVVDSCDEDAPTIRSTSGSAAGGGVTFGANVTDVDGVGPGTVNRVSVLYLDGTIRRSTELVDTGGGTYVATVSVCDAEGACGTDTVVVSVTGGTAAPVAECTVLSPGRRSPGGALPTAVAA